MPDQQPAGFVPDGFVPDAGPSAASRQPPAGVVPDGFVPDAPTFHTTNAVDPQGNPLVAGAKNFLGELHSLNPVDIVKSVQTAFWHPIDTAKGLLSAQDQVRQDAMTAFHRGDYVTGTAKFLDYLFPLIGPRMSQAGDLLQAGQYAKGAGAFVDAAVPIVLPEAIKAVPLKAPAILSTARLSPADAASNAFAEARGVPLDAATATGSKFIQGTQKYAGESALGGLAADTARARQAAALTRVGGELADAARGAATTPEVAGQGLVDALRSKLQAHQDLAQQAYSTVEQRAAQRGITVPTGAVKQALTPLYQGLKREGELAPLMGGKADTLRALDRFMTAPDAVPLMDAEGALGAIKSLSRLKQGQEAAMRTPGQAAAGVAVTTLQNAVDAAAIRSGVMRDLQTGRAATAAKFATNDVIDRLSGQEPVGFFKQVTRPKDASVDLLRTVADQAPQAVPQIARGYLEDLLGQASERGRFDHADKLYAEWQKLGPETKRTLFPAEGQVGALDNFFLLAKRIGTNPNPSGTAGVLIKAGEIGGALTQPLISIPTSLSVGALAKLLYSPAGVKVLTQGLRFSAGGQRAAAALQFSRALDLLTEGLPGRAPLGVPALASEPSPARQP